MLLLLVEVVGDGMRYAVKVDIGTQTGFVSRRYHGNEPILGSGRRCGLRRRRRCSSAGTTTLLLVVLVVVAAAAAAAAVVVVVDFSFVALKNVKCASLTVPVALLFGMNDAILKTLTWK
jgi:hypothetical protein